MKFNCPSCQTSYQVSDDLAGKQIRCRSCEARSEVPDGRITFRCAKCGTEDKIPEKYAGTEVSSIRCWNCNEPCELPTVVEPEPEPKAPTKLPYVNAVCVGLAIVGAACFAIGIVDLQAAVALIAVGVSGFIFNQAVGIVLKQEAEMKARSPEPVKSDETKVQASTKSTLTSNAFILRFMGVIMILGGVLLGGLWFLIFVPLGVLCNGLSFVVSSIEAASPKTASQDTSGKLQPCPDCNRDISKRATACPHCGCPLNQEAT